MVQAQKAVGTDLYIAQLSYVFSEKDFLYR